MPPPLKSTLRRTFLCRFGVHGPRLSPTGQPANYCGFCGFAFNPQALHKWVVELRNGERHEVEAINEWHAGSVVVYGDGPAAIDGRTGAQMGDAKVHRENILSVKPAQTQTKTRR